MDDSMVKILMEIKAEQGRQAGDIKAILEQCKKTNGSVLDHDKRIRALETKQIKAEVTGNVKGGAWKWVADVAKTVAGFVIGALYNEWRAGR